MAKILIVDELSSKSGSFCEQLEKLGHRIFESDSVAAAIRIYRDDAADILFVLQPNDEHSVVESLRLLKGESSLHDVPIVVVTSAVNSEEVIEAMKLGAFDHLSNSVSNQDLESVISRALSAPRQSALLETKQQTAGLLIGICPAMRQVEKLIGLAAGCDATVLVQGETGSGKDTVARTIYAHSGTTNNPLTVVDCTAVPEDYGSFESLLPGAGGTVILDEIGDLNSQMQAMLVRALKEKTNDSETSPRIIATTQYDLISMVKEKLFREDLFYRLNVLSISLPPLRERGSDILALAEAFLSQARPGSPKRLSSSSAKILLEHKWPGNVRELENLMYHLTYAVQSLVVEASDLSTLAANSEGEEVDILDYYAAMSALEKRLLERALKEANGSRAEAARRLGINRQLLYNKLKVHGLMN